MLPGYLVVLWKRASSTLSWTFAGDPHILSAQQPIKIIMHQSLNGGKTTTQLEGSPMHPVFTSRTTAKNTPFPFLARTLEWCARWLQLGTKSRIEWLL
jgi:hypothetical protein